LSADLLSSALQVQVATANVGGLYRFELTDPMTVPNRSSTMIALLNTQVPGEALYLFTPGAALPAAQRHPFRAVSVENKTPVIWESGPITIVRDGAFVGEGLIDRIEKGDRTYIAYALDTSVNVTYAQSNGTEFASLSKMSRGIIEAKAYAITRHTFEVAVPADGEAIPFVVGLPKRAGYELDAGAGKVISETAAQRFFSVLVKPGATVTLAVKEKQPTYQSYSINSAAGQDGLILYLTSNQVRPEVLKKLEPVMDKVRELADARSAILLLEQKRADLQSRAADLRANVAQLRASGNTNLVNEQTARLMEIDQQLGHATEELVRNREKQGALLAQVRTFIEKIDLRL
jgi:hypothetical protein